VSNARTHARRFIVQALYQWHMTEQNIADIENEFLALHDSSKVDITYFRECLHAIPGKLDELEACFTASLDRPLKEVDPVELAILRLGTYELAHRLDIPYRVVINESVQLAKRFGAEDGYKYINSVLDGVAATLRDTEVKAHKSQ